MGAFVGWGRLGWAQIRKEFGRVKETTETTYMLPCCYLSRSLVPPQVDRVRVQLIVLALNTFRAGGTTGNGEY